MGHVYVGFSEANLRDYVVALDLAVYCDLVRSEAVSERKGEEHGPAVGGVDGVVELWSGEEEQLASQQEGGVGQDMELLDWPAL